VSGDQSPSRAANARNNAQYQRLRLQRWADVRDQLWTVLEPLVHLGARVAIVGGGSCDDVPIRRVVGAGARVDLVDLDPAAAARGRRRVSWHARRAVRTIALDVTDGCADDVIHAVREQRPAPRIVPPTGPLGAGGYDLVVGDMLYTQLLHAGLISLGVFGDRQQELMRRYDPPLTRALVHRVQASLAPGGHAVHIHDLACWSTAHTQPMSLTRALRDPESSWRALARHDACDPALVLDALRIPVRATAWWEWPFEPNKQFLVRAVVARR
jgi:hypothetical protein